MMLDHYATLVTLLGAVLAGLGWFWVKVGSKILQFLDDWRGEEARPGVPARPGVMERVKNLDDGQLAIIDRLAKVETQVHPNHGSSLADAVNRIEQAVRPPE